MSIEAPSITLDIQANPNVHDSFIVCLCAILEVWGRSTDYAYVAGLSGVAFSLVLDTRFFLPGKIVKNFSQIPTKLTIQRLSPILRNPKRRDTCTPIPCDV